MKTMSKRAAIEAVDYMHRAINAAVFGIPGEQLPELHEKLDLICAELTKEPVPVDAVSDPLDTMSAAFDKMSQRADEILQVTSQSIPLEKDVQEAFERLECLNEPMNADLALLKRHIERLTNRVTELTDADCQHNAEFAAARLAHEQTRKELATYKRAQVLIMEDYVTGTYEASLKKARGEE